jgi:hypothetical protein
MTGGQLGRDKLFIMTGTDEEDALSDLLADLLHWCARQHVTFDRDWHGPGFTTKLTRSVKTHEHLLLFCAVFDIAAEMR